jgi:hypothetical protein
MSTINLKAHFDGTSIQLDEPCDLPQNVPLLLTVLTPEATDVPVGDWAELGAAALARAYGDHEPDYSPTDVLP